MNFLVVGGGSIGRRHLCNLLALSQKAAVIEPMAERAHEINKKYKVLVYSKLEAALDKEVYDAALICNPNVFHLKTAVRIARRGIHLFIEKPLSHSMAGVEELIRLVKKNRLHTFMGSNFKFHKSVKAMKKLLDERAIGKVLSFTVVCGQYLPDWHPWEDYRKGYSANKSLGGGILLDSHEFDYIQWLLGPIKKIACITGKYSGLEIDTEDVAEAIVELKSDAVGSIHVDYIQHPYRRVYMFYGEKGTLEWDHTDKRVSLYKFDDKKWTYFREGKYDPNRMYIDEIRHFIGVLKGKELPVTDIYAARQILNVLFAAKESSRLGRFMEVK